MIRGLPLAGGLFRSLNKEPAQRHPSVTKKILAVLFSHSFIRILNSTRIEAPAASHNLQHSGKRVNMAQRTLLPLLVASAGAVFAQSTSANSSASSSVVDIILPMLEPQTIMASVVGVDATATTFFLTCPTDAVSLQCGLGKGLEIVEGPEVLEVHMTQANVV